MPSITPQIIRSRRRTLSLMVADDARLIVRAPHHLPLNYIEEFIRKKKRWITRRLEELSKRPKIDLTDEQIKELIKKAREKITERCRYFSDLIGLKPSKIRITGARGRWGSCGIRGTLNFTWRLILVPDDILDYVVVHELTHLVVRNHSKRFWDKVERIVPDLRGRRRWLRGNGHLLAIDNV